MAENKVQVIIAGENQMGGVLSQVGSQLDGFVSKLGGLEGILEKLAVVEVAHKLIEFGEKTLEAEVNLLHMSQRTGVAVEQLSELAYAAQASGIPIDALEKGMKKLQVTLSNAAAGNQQAIASLAAVGVNARDAQGKVLGAADALEQIAKKFAATKDGSDKAALAVQIFGRAGTTMIPLLDKGAAGIAQLREEAHRLGVVLTEEDKQAVEEFHGNLIRLQAISQGLMQHFLGGLLPALNNIADAMTTGVDGFDAMKGAGEGLGTFIKLLYEGFEALATVVAIVGQKMLLVAESMLALSNADMAGSLEAIKKFFGVIEDKATTDLINRLGAIDEALWGNKSHKSSDASNLDDLQRKHDEAEAIRKAKLANQMNSEKLAAEFAKSINDIQLKNVEELYKHELISVQEYFDKKQKLQADSLKAEIFANKQELALQDALSEDKKVPELARIEALGKVKQLTEKNTVLTAQLNAVLYKKPDGSDDPLAAKAAQMEIYAAEAMRLQEQIDHVYSRLADDIAAVTTAAKNQGLGQEAVQGRVNELNEAARTKVQGLTQDYQALAAQSGDKKLIDNAEKLRQKYEELGHQLNWVRDTAVSSLQSSFENFFTSLDGSWQGALNAFKNFGLGVIQMIDQILAKMLAMYFIEKLLGFALGAIGGGGGGAAGDVSGMFGEGVDIGGAVPFLAGGGDLMAGQLAVVGEDGPEFFRAGSGGGSVIPMDKMSGSAGQGDNYYIDARGADAGVEQRVMRALAQVKSDAVRASVYAVTDRSLRT